MGDVDSGDILRIGAGLIYDGLYDVVNVWHLLTQAVATRTWALAEVMIQAWLDAAYDGLDVVLTDSIGTGPVSVSNVTQGTTLGTIAWSPTWSGAVGGDPTASGVCCFVWGRTYKPRVQIRKYFGVFSEGGVTDGSWVAAVQDACEAVMDYAIAPHEVAAFSAIQAVAYNRTLETYEVANSVGVAAEPAYQRRRKRGRGS